MVESEGAFRLTFVQGRGLLSLAGQDFEGLGRVELLELEIPNLRFPFDVSRGVARFKNRRLRLRELALLVGTRELGAFLAKAPLSDFGIFHPQITLEGTRLLLCARVALGGREAEITAVAALSPLPPRGVRLCVYDVRCYGFLPIPAPLVVLALFSALGADSPARHESAAAFPLLPLLHVRSAAEIHVDACDLAMLAILPMHGWRLPERAQVRVRAAGGVAEGAYVPLAFSQEATSAESAEVAPRPSADVDADAVAMDEFAARCAPIENALARGDIASTLSLLRTLSPLEAEDEVGTARLLQLLVAGEGTLDEASEVANAAHVRWPTFVPAVLTLAATARERGQPAEAALRFERAAQLSAAQGRATDESCALLAAARCFEAAGQLEQALDALERALLRRASLRPVARARIMKLAVEGRWAELLANVGEESAVAEPDMRDEVAQVMELVRQGGMAKDASLVAQAAASLEALLAREHWTETSLSRAEAAYQMGLVRLAAGDDRSASHWFATCIEGDPSGPVAAVAWQAETEILRRCAGPAAVMQALAGWAEDVRVPESSVEKVKHLLEAAEIAECELEQIAQATPLLETALRLSPADETVLRVLERLGGVSVHSHRVAEVLRRHLREIRPDQGRAVLRVLIRLLVEHRDRHGEVREACQVLLSLCPGDEDAIYGLARVDWDAGEREQASHGYRILVEGKLLGRGKVAECQLRAAQAAWAAGQREEAEHYLAQGLASEPEGAKVEVLCEALGELGREDQLSALLAGREVAPSDPKLYDQVQRSLATSAERQGDLDRAESIYQQLLAANPDDVELLDRLASICKRQSRDEDLARWLERLWLIVEREGLSTAASIDGIAVGLDLAAILGRAPEGKPRAEAILRRLLQAAPTDFNVLDSLHKHLIQRGAFDEASQVFAQRLAATPAEEVSSLLVSRAGQCLAEPQGLRPALAMLQSLAAEDLDEDPLTLRADLAERAGDTVDAASCLQRLRARVGDGERASISQHLAQRLIDLAARPTTAIEVAVTVLETLHTEAPNDLSVAMALFDAYGRYDDVETRNRAWEDLLAKVPALPDLCRARLQVALSEAVGREGDLQAAERMLDEAIKLDQSPVLRAEQLLAHARLLAARGEIPRAQKEAEHALALDPDLLGAMVLVADLAYRAQEWDWAREMYARLAEMPGAADVVAPQTLALRRAELAEMFGDHVEAEAAYREVIALNPDHDGAREALSGLALVRGDLAEAALHLQQVVRLLPKDSVDRLTLARQRLGQVYLGLGDLQAAQRHLELALAGDPDRPSTMEQLITTYERLGRGREAAATCEKLARALADPVRKAEALFRKGELLRSSLSDEDGAIDAYLRASDIDPNSVPTLSRLASYYWSLGELGSLADVGGDLLRATSVSKSDEGDTGLLVAAAALLFRNDEAMAKTALESATLGAPLRPELAVKRLAEIAQQVARGGLDSLDVVLRFMGTVLPADFQDGLRAATLAAVLQDPGAVGQALLLARLFDRDGDLARARAAYSLAQFIDPAMGAGQRLAEIGEFADARPEVHVHGAVVHPLCRGPLRKVLHYLAPVLASPSATDASAIPPSAETLALFEKLRVQLHAPAFRAVLHGDGVDVTLSVAQPLSILVGRRAELLPEPDLCFFLARALEQARAGTLAVLRMSDDHLRGMLRAVRRVAGAPGTPFELAEEAADEATAPWLARLRQSQAAAQIFSGEMQSDLVEQATHALANPPELEAYIRGCRYTADRVGILLCGQPLAALRGLTGFHKDDGGAAGSTVARRQEQLRASQTLRELVAFMLSEEYGAITGDRRSPES